MNDVPASDRPRVARRNRWLLLALLASFVVPFLIGDLAYRHGWYKGGQTNRGRLIDPPVAFADLSARTAAGQPAGAAFADRHWWLLYVVPARCEQACRNRLFQMRQVRRALGKEGERLRQVLVFTAPPAAATEALIAREFAGFVQLQAPAASVDAALRRVTPGASVAGLLYIMDPMGWMMLAYAPEADEKTSVTKAEDILKDLQKLLKVSRIG